MTGLVGGSAAELRRETQRERERENKKAKREIEREVLHMYQRLPQEVVLLPQSNFLCDPKADSDEEVVFCKPMISMDLPKWSYILDSY